MPQPRGGASVGLRRAVRLAGTVERTEQIALDRPLDVISDHQIELAIAIVIHPGCAGGKLLRTPQACRLGHIAEGSSAVVVEQVTLTEGSNEDILVAIVVVVTDGDT